MLNPLAIRRTLGMYVPKEEGPSFVTPVGSSSVARRSGGWGAVAEVVVGMESNK